MSEARNSSTRTVTWLDFLRGDMQHFDGNLRKYPRFKSGSIRLVVIEMTSADSAAYVLKSFGSKVVFDLVSNVEKTLEEKRSSERLMKDMTYPSNSQIL